MVNYYRVLGLEPNASQATIIQKYQFLMSSDYQGPKVDRDLVEQAYTNLNSTEKRKAYDDYLDGKSPQGILPQAAELQISELATKIASDPGESKRRPIYSQAELDNKAAKWKRQNERFDKKFGKGQRQKPQNHAGPSRSRGLHLTTPVGIMATEDAPKGKRADKVGAGEGLGDDDNDDGAVTGQRKKKKIFHV
ncbi:MAG: hypothetical protein Q9225_008002 [Loekoesia sp. 1 TL-2023]